MIRVLVTDPHGIVAQGLSRVLADERDLDVGVPVTTAQEAVSYSLTPGTDVIVMDAQAVRAAPRAIASIRQSPRGTHVVVLASQPDVAGAIHVLRAGASGYVQSSLAAAVLVALLDPTGGTDPMARLSAREQDIVRFLVQGRRKVDIARELSLSPKTIETFARAQWESWA